MCRIGGRLRSSDASQDGADVEIPPLCYWDSNLSSISGEGTLSGG